MSILSRLGAGLISSIMPSALTNHLRTPSAAAKAPRRRHTSAVANTGLTLAPSAAATSLPATSSLVPTINLPPTNVPAPPFSPLAARGADGMTPWERVQVFESQLKTDFGWEEKMAAPGANLGLLHIEFQRYRRERLAGHSAASLEPVVARLPIVAAARRHATPATILPSAIPAPTIPTPVVQAAQPPPKNKSDDSPPAVDADGVPQKSAPTAESVIQQLLYLLEQLKQKLGSDNDAVDQTEAKAAASAMAAGDHSMALFHLWNQFRTTATAAVAHSNNPYRTIRAQHAHVQASSVIPPLDLPDFATARPSADTNKKYSTAIAILSQKIAACAADGLIPQELIAKKNQLDRDWTEINRRPR